MHTRALAFAPLLVCTLPVACGGAGSTEPQEPASAAQPGGEEPAAAGACDSSADCPEHQICVGPPGCDAEWTCRPTHDVECTEDLVEFCDCEGVTFESSSTCVGVRYAHAGACGRPAEPAEKPRHAGEPGGVGCSVAERSGPP